MDGLEHLRSFRTFTVTTAFLLGIGCASSSPSGGSGGSSGSGTGGAHSGTGGSAPGSGGSTPGTGGSTTGTGGAHSGTGGSAPGTGGRSTGTGGTIATGGNTGTGGLSTGSGGTGGSAGSTGTGGSNNGGHGGVNAGTGGSNNGGHGGANAGTGGATSTGGATGGGGSSTAGCPANATFCSGFETNTLPSGAVYLVNAGPGDWSRDFAVDTSQKHSGSSSLLVKAMGDPGTSGSSYLMLAVPVPSGPFWVRFYVQSKIAMGGIAHNAFAGTSPSTDPNAVLDQFAEDVGISLHTSDSDVTWPTGYGRLVNGSTNPYTIPAMTWKCVEISYDLANRHQQLYIDGTLLIDAASYPPTTSYSGTFSTFKFGFYGYNGPPRQMWYDDVVVAPNRIGCQ